MNDPNQPNCLTIQSINPSNQFDSSERQSNQPTAQLREPNRPDQPAFNRKFIPAPPTQSSITRISVLLDRTKPSHLHHCSAYTRSLLQHVILPVFFVSFSKTLAPSKTKPKSPSEEPPRSRGQNTNCPPPAVDHPDRCRENPRRLPPSPGDLQALSRHRSLQIQDTNNHATVGVVLFMYVRVSIAAARKERGLHGCMMQKVIARGFVRARCNTNGLTSSQEGFMGVMLGV